MGWKKATAGRSEGGISVSLYYDEEEEEKEEEEKVRFANPQSFMYFYILYSITAFMQFPLLVAPHVLHNKKFHSFYIMMTIASVSMAVLASCILIFASFFRRTWIKDIHYTILRTTGCFFAMLALFSLVVAVFLPPRDHLNWIVLSVICVIFGGIYYFLWKYVFTYLQQQDPMHMNIHWSESLAVLSPISIALPPNLPPWAQTRFIYVCFYVLAAALFINACARFISRRKNRVRN